jgi:membrane protein
MASHASQGIWDRAVRLIERDIWEQDLDKSKPAWRAVMTLFRLGALVRHGFTEHHLTMRAAALTYTTVFSLVPTLAVALGVFKAFGGVERAKEVIYPYLASYLAVGVREDVAVRIEQILENISGGAIGAVGFLFMIIAALSLLSSMEDVFNDIWGVKQSRGYLQRFVVYWFVLTITPLVLVAVSIPSVLRNLRPLQWLLDHTGTAQIFFTVLLPLMLVCVGFAAMYTVLTSARIPLRSVTIGGLCGGTLWSSAVYGYASYAQNSEFYSSVYGSLSAIPIFLFWLYVSWVIVLLGAQVAFATENLTTYREELLASRASTAAQELLALRITVEVAGRFLRGEPPINRDELPHVLQASGRLVNRMVDKLLEIGCLVQVGAEERLGPGRDPRGVTPMELLDLLRQHGEDKIWLTKDKVTQELQRVCERLAREGSAAAGDTTIADVASSDSAQRKEH